MNDPVFATAAEALTALDELRGKRERARAVSDEIMLELQAAVRAAAAVIVDGAPMNRSVIIERSGLSRRTAYKILDTLPNTESRDDCA